MLIRQRHELLLWFLKENRGIMVVIHLWQYILLI